MITIQNFSEAIKFQITGGSPYGWQCFGHDARWLDSEDSKYSASIVFGGPDFTVFSAEICDMVNNRAYRWMHPVYKPKYDAEANMLGVNGNQAWDEVDYTDLEVAEDFLEKCAAIVDGDFDYDTRVSVPLTLSDSEMLQLMTMAHEADLTLNQFVEQVLKEQLGLLKE